MNKALRCLSCRTPFNFKVIKVIKVIVPWASPLTSQLQAQAPHWWNLMSAVFPSAAGRAFITGPWLNVLLKPFVARSQPPLATVLDFQSQSVEFQPGYMVPHLWLIHISPIQEYPWFIYASFTTSDSCGFTVSQTTYDSLIQTVLRIAGLCRNWPWLIQEKR